MPPLLAEDKLRNLRGCDWSGVFMPHVLIVFFPLMQTLSIITFSRDWKLQSLWNKNAAEEWNVYPLHPHYKAYKNQTIRPSTIAFRYRKPALLVCSKKSHWKLRPFDNQASAVISTGLPLKLVKLKFVIQISINKVGVITLFAYLQYFHGFEILFTIGDNIKRFIRQIITWVLKHPTTPCCGAAMFFRRKTTVPKILFSWCSPGHRGVLVLVLKLHISLKHLFPTSALPSSFQ